MNCDLQGHWWVVAGRRGSAACESAQYETQATIVSSGKPEEQSGGVTSSCGSRHTSHTSAEGSRTACSQELPRRLN